MTVVPSSPPEGLPAKAIDVAFSFLGNRAPVAWSRVLAMILLLLTGLFVALVWSERTQLIPLVSQIMHGPGLRIAEDRAPEVASRLLSVTGGRATLIFSYDLERYTRKLVLGRAADGRTLLDGMDERPITNGARGYSQLIDGLLTGEVPCFGIDARAASDVRLLERAEGVHAFCLAGIPPAYGLGLQGAISLFLTRMPDDADAAQVRVALRAAAAALTRRP